MLVNLCLSEMANFYYVLSQDSSEITPTHSCKGSKDILLFKGRLEMVTWCRILST